jgi:hypothetical protein
MPWFRFEAMCISFLAFPEETRGRPPLIPPGPTYHGPVSRLVTRVMTRLFHSFPPDRTTAWREAAEDARLAYQAWCDADRSVAADAYAVFVAAADREAAAAEHVARRR